MKTNVSNETGAVVSNETVAVWCCTINYEWLKDIVKDISSNSASIDILADEIQQSFRDLWSSVLDDRSGDTLAILKAVGSFERVDWLSIASLYYELPRPQLAPTYLSCAAPVL